MAGSLVAAFSSAAAFRLALISSDETRITAPVSATMNKVRLKRPQEFHPNQGLVALRFENDEPDFLLTTELDHAATGELRLLTPIRENNSRRPMEHKA